jgi:hypothetical protein
MIAYCVLSSLEEGIHENSDFLKPQPKCGLAAYMPQNTLGGGRRSHQNGLSALGGGV